MSAKLILSIMLRHFFTRVCSFVLFVSCALHAEPLEISPAAKPLDHPAIKGCTVKRDAARVWIVADRAEQPGQVEIPRFSALLRSVKWLDGSEEQLTLVPEPQHWVISWKKAPGPSAKGTLVLTFDTPTALPEELSPAVSAADQSITLHAYQATTTGEKVRYEPQPHKNTVGYWVGKEDAASWTIEIAAPGKYSVAVLQGCGKSQGGSEAILQVMQGHEVKAELSFQTVDTGHFQNFQWCHLGYLNLTEAGKQRLIIKPKQIAKAALFDVRSIQLVRQTAP